MNETQVEIRAVINFLWKKGLDNSIIYSELLDVYKNDAPALRTIQDRTKKLREGTCTIFDLPRKGRPERTDLEPKIRNFLTSNPYASTKKIAKITNADIKTVKNILINKLQMRKVNFKWVPHLLTEEIKAKRVHIAKELLEFLTTANERKIRMILTQDETWVYFVNPRNTMWLESGQPCPQKVKQTIGAKKAMISVIWGITGIKSITMLPLDRKFNREFFAEVVLEDLAQKIKTKGYFLHLDNARPHLVAQKFNDLGIKRLDHPPYSPDLAPSDFFLFGYVKKLLEGCEFQDENELLEKVTELLYNIPKDIFKSVYNEWMNRLFMVIENQGEYIN